MLNQEHQVHYEKFYQSTIKGKSLSEREMALVGLASAISLNCGPCTDYYLDVCEKNKITNDEINDVLAKAMAVSAGQKNIQFSKLIKQSKNNKGGSCSG